MGNNPLENMQSRAAQCRRLADLTHDRSMADQLRQWASEIETDIRRLEADGVRKEHDRQGG
jgi:hypothetical protein